MSDIDGESHSAAKKVKVDGDVASDAPAAAVAHDDTAQKRFKKKKVALLLGFLGANYAGMQVYVFLLSLIYH